MQRPPEVVEPLLRAAPRAPRMVRRHVDHQALEVGDVAPQAGGLIASGSAHDVSVRTSPTMTIVSSVTATTMNSE